MPDQLEESNERFIHAVHKTLKMGNVVEQFWDIDYPARARNSSEVSKEFVSIDVAETVLDAISTCKQVQVDLVRATNCHFRIRFIYCDVEYIEPVDDEIIELMLLVS